MGKVKCSVCGCTEEHACPGGCYWVEENLCSCCAAGDTRKLAAKEEDAYKIPDGIGCYFPGGKSCPWAHPHPMNGKRCCGKYGDLQLVDVFKLALCREESGGMP